MKLEGKVALVTGGGRGIGAAVARAYATEGASVAICSRTENELNETANTIRELGAVCFASTCDLSDEASVTQFVSAVQSEFGRIDVLVNNAGVMTRPVPFDQVDVKKWDYTITVNLRGTFLVTRAVLPAMKHQNEGCIINVSSMIGRQGYPNFSAYAASKWGIEGLTQTLAAELRGGRIRVNSVDPGYIATKVTGYRGSDPESTTAVFVYLASDEASTITGQALDSSSWK
jgi:NAD(P)-dependent dehydrogenase (short-subunit alcohol dehydrogenase family)